jgi:hypothetical protein
MEAAPLGRLLVSRSVAGNDRARALTRKGNCWDNAPMESFFGTLKTGSAPDSCAAARSSASWRRSASTSFMPMAANRFAAARPMPLAPPVMTATQAVNRAHAKFGYTEGDGKQVILLTRAGEGVAWRAC